MEFVFFGAFSIFAAVIFNFLYPKIQATAWAQSASAKGYIGMTLVTGAAFFVVLFVASLLMGIVTNKRAMIPAA